MSRAILFSLTLFVSAGLLFLVQPMIARRVLPLLGGSPAVWNTCVVFFQAALLAGYGYAHLRPRGQGILHLILLAVAAVVLPPRLAWDWAPPEEVTPVFWLLGVLAVSVGLPFVVVGASAPLLQKWFARTGSDPYFLYAASNLGSLLALVAYPFLVEPNLALDEQGLWWSVGYALLWGLTALCLWATRAARRAGGA